MIASSVGLKEGARPIDPDPELLSVRATRSSGHPDWWKAPRFCRSRAFPINCKTCSVTTNMPPCLSERLLCDTAAHLGHVSPIPSPHDCRVESVTYISGDTWNVNPDRSQASRTAVLQERASPDPLRLSHAGHAITLVPVAAILVASIRLSFLAAGTDIRRGGTRTMPLDVPLRKGEEMGWFQHGSTIIVFTPDGFALSEGVREGARIRVGQPLMRLPCRPKAHDSERPHNRSCLRHEIKR